jgi:hypothetical protein
VIEYKPDRDNLAADALSRSFMMVLSNEQSLSLQQIHRAIASDVNLTASKTQFSACTQPDPYYQIQYDF